MMSVGARVRRKHAVNAELPANRCKAAVVSVMLAS